MLLVMVAEGCGDALLLVIDTCAERASLALFGGRNALLEERFLEERAASSTLLSTLRSVLHARELTVEALTAVGVVHGPGSFTGVRVGVAFAKGLCEARGIPLAAVSRLAVLAEAGELTSGFAVLRAGRGEVYVRELGPGAAHREWMTSLGALESVMPGQATAVESPELASSLRSSGAQVHVTELSARHAMPAVQRCFAQGGSDVVSADANYVRNEAAIYAKAVQPG